MFTGITYVKIDQLEEFFNKRDDIPEIVENQRAAIKQLEETVKKLNTQVDNG